MKDKANYETENNRNNKPLVNISVTNLDIEIEEGKVFKDSFLVQSENRVPIKGLVFSTNDKLGLEKTELNGIKKEIVYFFKGKLTMAGSEFEGDFVILTNGGEFNIPYRVRVVPKMADTSIGKISRMEDFARLYEEYPQEAMDFFFHSGFPEVFLKEEPEKRALYHSLMKGRIRPLILEEFMAAAGYKEPVFLTTDETPITLNDHKERMNIFNDQEEETGTLNDDDQEGKTSILLRLSGHGYLEGRIYSEKNIVRPSVERFTSADFKDGLLAVTLEKNDRPVSGSDVIHVTTVRQDFSIPVEWWQDVDVYQEKTDQGRTIRQLRAELMHNYLYFRTGSIGFEDFAQEAHRILDDLSYLTKDMVWKLYLMHLLLMENSIDQAKEMEKELLEYEKESPFDPLPAQYLMYLKAMVNRTPDAIGEAVASIRSFYESSRYKAEALWMLIYLDREYVYNKRLQYDTIRELFKAGNNSCLLYFEACEILNDNPGYMEDLGAFEISVFRWGVRYGFVSMALACQFARLASKMKYYSRPVFSVAERLYKVEPDDRFLQVICSLLIKGNKFGKEYHDYFHAAVESNLKIVGLNEFFIRSMDFKHYEEIPQRVLIYFTYSNSLDYVEKAYLYTNILKNKDLYEEVYGAYYSKMLPFVEEQLLKERMNEHLAYLYTFFQKDLLEKPEHVREVCDILFCHRIRCSNPRMSGVYIISPETGEENYYPLSGGSCQVQFMNKRSLICFTDPTEQRYVTGIDYELTPFLTLSQLPEEWLYRNLANQKILRSQSDKVDGSISKKDLPILQGIAFNEYYLPWMRQKALEKLLVYYENHQDKKELSRWLERTAYTDISPAFRKQLMDYYLEVGMPENAFFGIELYGSHIMGAAKQLRLASFGVKHFENRLDETTLSLAYSAFLRKKYNRDTLGYLMKHFEGELEDLLTIWERSLKLKISTGDFEKKIIYQSMFTGNHTEGVFPVFESFYEASPEDPLAGQYLEYLSSLELAHSMNLSEEIHRIIGKEILGGRIKDKRARIRFLYYFADDARRQEEIREPAEMIIREFLKEEFYLPVYEAYSEWVSLPVDYTERTFLTYKGSPGQDIKLFYRIERENGEPRERHLLEVLPGMYVTSLHFYQNDHVNYRLVADGEPVQNKDNILFETFEYEGDDSRFFELNHLMEKKESSQVLKEYLLKAFFTDEFMTLL